MARAAETKIVHIWDQSELSLKSKKRRWLEVMAEIEEEKRRSEERATKKAQHEEENAMFARGRTRAESKSWEEKEPEFPVEQNNLSSEIREGGAEPTDVLPEYLNMSDNVFDVKVVDPKTDTTDLDRKWGDILEEQEAYLERKWANVQEEQRADLVRKWAQVQEEQRADLEQKWADLLEAQRADLERKWADVLEEQRCRLQDAALLDHENPELTLQERALVLKATGGMEEGDVELGSVLEVILEPESYWWHDKYRRRKPKYFNRVHTSYDWNKCNQTHLDHDNPPTKAVLGYKFSIFYPNLVDKTIGPTPYRERE